MYNCTLAVMVFVVSHCVATPLILVMTFEDRNSYFKELRKFNGIHLCTPGRVDVHVELHHLDHFVLEHLKL